MNDPTITVSIRAADVTQLSYSKALGGTRIYMRDGTVVVVAESDVDIARAVFEAIGVHVEMLNGISEETLNAAADVRDAIIMDDLDALRIAMDSLSRALLYELIRRAIMDGLDKAGLTP